jgi:hypothetical protein
MNFPKSDISDKELSHLYPEEKDQTTGTTALMGSSRR